MKKPHLLFTSWEYPQPGTKGNPFIASRARTLAKHGVKVSLLHIHFSTPFNFVSNFIQSRKLVKEEKKYGIEVVYIPCINLFPSGLFSSALAGVQKQMIFLSAWLRIKLYIVFNGKPDAIHHHYIANGTPYITEFISRAFKIPYIVSEHSSRAVNMEYLKKKANHFYSDQDFVAFVRNASACSAIAKRYADKFAELFKKEFLVIPNPIPDYFIKKELPAFPKSTENGFYFISVGNLTPKKNHLRLIRAFAKKFKNREGVFLRIAGDGAMREQLEKEILTLGLSGKVQMLGYITREQVMEYMDASHALAIGSDFEIISSTMVEGWFRGLPVVSTDVGAHSDIINSANGVISEKAEDDLSEKLQYMAENYHTYNPGTIIKSARERYEEKEIVNKFLTMYDGCRK